MSYDIAGDYEISGDYEIGAEENSLASEVGALKARKIRRLTHKVAKRHARDEAAAAVNALRDELRGGPLAGPSVTEKGPGKLYEIPFPLGSVTAAKSGAVSTAKNNAQAPFRCERLVVDESAAAPNINLLAVQDIRLGNISQLLSGGQMLATFFGPGVFNTPFRGMTIGNGMEAAVDFIDRDAAADKVAFATFFGNALRG